MCGDDPNASPWNLLIFVGVSLTAFVNPRRVFLGSQQIIMENILLVLIVVPVLFVQLKLGGLTQKSALGLFNTHFPLLRGVALLLLVELFYIGTYLPALSVHAICTGFVAVSDEGTKMVRCDNVWNTQNCWNPLHQPRTNTDFSWNSSDVQQSFSRTPPIEEYFQRVFYNHDITDKPLDDLGGFSSGIPVFPIALVVTWVFVFLIVAFGPRVLGWILSIIGVLATTFCIAVLGYGWSQIAQIGYDMPTVLMYYYFPNFEKLKMLDNWANALSIVSYVTMVWAGVMPTMGKFAGKGRISRNISWFFVVLSFAILRHLPILTIAPFQQRAVEVLNVDANELLSHHLDFTLTLAAFVYSGANGAIIWLYFFAQYLYYICALALFVAVLVDNIVEAFQWLIEKFHWNKRAIWIIVTAVVSLIMMLLGIPYTTRRGLDLLFFVDGALAKFLSFKAVLAASGFIVIYAWQNVHVAEKLVVGTWFILASAVTGAFLLLQASHWFGEIYLRSGVLPKTSKWVTISWLIPASPFVFVPLGMLLHLLLWGTQWKRRPTANTLSDNEHPPTYEETLLSDRPRQNYSTDPRTPHSDTSVALKEDVQIVSTC